MEVLTAPELRSSLAKLQREATALEQAQKKDLTGDVDLNEQIQDLERRMNEWHDQWSRQFCSQICTLLPREIRDQIYRDIQEFIGEVHPYVNTNFLNIVPGWELHDRSLDYTPRAEHTDLFAADKVGRQLATEMGQIYYNRMVFHLPSVRDIRSLLENDTFQLGLLPTEHIRNIRIHINAIGGVNGAFETSPTDMNENLPHLLSIKNKKKLKLDLIVRIGHFPVLKTFLIKLARTLLPLINDEAKVAVHQYDNRFGGGDARNITGLFTGTVEECVAKIWDARPGENFLTS